MEDYNTENGKAHFLEVWNWMHSDEETRMPIEEKFKELEAKYGFTRETCEKYIEDIMIYLKSNKIIP